MSKIRYLISYFVETKTDVKNYQTLFDTYDEAIEFGRKISLASNIKSVCLETLIVSYSETTIIKH